MAENQNMYGGKCANCGEWVEAGAGRRRKLDGAWQAEHVECPGNGNAPALPTWAVPCAGRTEGGNQASGYTIVRGPVSHPDAVPLDAAAVEAARWTATGEDPAPPDEAARRRLGLAWEAFAELEGYRPRRRNVAELDEALDGFDVAEMRAAVARERAEIMRRFGVEESER